MISLSMRLAWRNLWRHKRRSWLTIAAMIFSNCLLVFGISLQFGSYEMMIDNSLQVMTGHVQIQHESYLDNPAMRYTVPDIETTAARLRDELGLQSISPRALGFALISSQERSYGVQVLGVDPTHETLVSNIPGLVKRGRNLQPGSAEEIVIGSILARNLKLELGDEVTLLGNGFDGSIAAVVLTVSGIFESGLSELDRNIAQVNLPLFQTAFALNDRGHAIVIRANHLDEVSALQRRINRLLEKEESLAVRHWDHLQPGLKQAIQADMVSAWFMYMVLVILVAFSVLNTQLMSVLERTREFGTMMALGLKPANLSRLVITETLIMSTLGLGLGVFVGFALVYYLSLVGFSYPGMDEMSQKFNLPDRLYPAISFVSIFSGPVIVGIGSLLAAIYPALRLLVLRPVEAMRAV